MMKVVPLDGPFGVAIEGIDLSGDMSDFTARKLIDLMHEHQVIVIRSPGLSNADYVRFSYKWGRPLSFMIKSQTGQDYPEIIKVSNATTVPERYRDGARHWHSDSSYESEPAAVTMLYGIEVPDEGGETLFASSRLAYDALDAATRERIEPMMGIHVLGGSPELPGERIKIDIELIARQGLHHHPLVMRHPVTGTRAIFTSATIWGIDGIDSEEARELIYRLRQHVTQPRFTLTYKIQVGELMMWDNFQVMHSATPIAYSDEPGKRRMLYRISTKGIPDLCRVPAMA